MRVTTWRDNGVAYGGARRLSSTSPSTTPYYPDCMMDGEIHREGSSFVRTTEDGCSDCVCHGGNIQCTPTKDSCPPVTCRQPLKVSTSQLSY